MTKTGSSSSQEASGSPHIDFDALYRGESPGEGTAAITAERRAKDAGVDVKFAVADSTKLDCYTDVFDTVIDVGLFHSLNEKGRRSYAAAVHRATRHGAALLLSCFSDANPIGKEPRPAVSENTLRGPRRRRLGHRPGIPCCRRETHARLATALVDETPSA